MIYARKGYGRKRGGRGRGGKKTTIATPFHNVMGDSHMGRARKRGKRR